MQIFANLPVVGAVVIVITLILFVLAVILLFTVYRRYISLTRAMTSRGAGDPFVDFLKEDFVAAYKLYGQNTNTPAIINNAVAVKLNKLLFCERFMNNAVSLFVTLGLFGTFLGLSLSVSSLTDLLALSNSQEWLSILNSVGGGLVSALSGMGVAFYTSLVGVACAIVFTLLRSICNPQVQREKMETTAELWLDQAVAPKLTTEFAYDDESRMLQLKDELRAHAAAVEASLNGASTQMAQSLAAATQSLGQMIEYSKEPLTVFYNTVNTFNENVRDFSEFNYDLRGNIERMDVSFRDFSTALHQTERALTAAMGQQQPAPMRTRRAAAPDPDDNGGRRA